MNAPLSTARPLLPALCLGILLLSGCGGGGGGADDESADTSATEAEAAATSALSALLGTYAVPCEGSTDTALQPGSASSQGTLTISEEPGTGRTAVSIHVQDYASATGDTSGSRCDAAALVWDSTVTGYIRDLGIQKAIRTTPTTTVNAKVVEFTYSGVTIRKGSFSGQLPTPNMTTRLAYLLEDGNLRLTSGPREADGVAAKFNRRIGVRQ